VIKALTWLSVRIRAFIVSTVDRCVIYSFGGSGRRGCRIQSGVTLRNVARWRDPANCAAGTGVLVEVPEGWLAIGRL
jgi:hypothetical protein